MKSLTTAPADASPSVVMAPPGRRESRPPLALALLVALSGAKILFHLPFLARYGFHRDELLYLALGDHPAFGYWSNGPVIGWISAVVQFTLGGSVMATRLPALAAGAAVVIFAGLIARELGAGRYGQGIAALAVLVSPSFLRTSSLFQPVAFDILMWTVLTLLLVRYLNRENNRDVVLFGVVFGLGLLVKYNVGFMLLGLLPVLMMSGHRRMLGSRAVLAAAAAVLLIVLPNLVWQISHGFPVLTHLHELAANQLGHVRPVSFLTDQAVLHAGATLVWLPGLAWLLAARPGRPYRVAGWTAVATIVIFLMLSGKSYYTLGLYPLLIAAGGTALAAAPRVVRVVMPLALMVLLIPVLPLAVPALSLERQVAYGSYLIERVGLEAPLRWETGEVHLLPQDYADMLGWEELARLTESAVRRAGDERVLVYASNYGQAGAIAHLARGVPPVRSFSDSFRLWAPDSTDAETLVFVGRDLGADVREAFSIIEIIGEVRTPHAREAGTRVYLLREPIVDVSELWAERVAAIRR